MKKGLLMLALAAPILICGCSRKIYLEKETPPGEVPPVPAAEPAPARAPKDAPRPSPQPVKLDSPASTEKGNWL